jgi:hypothetical protein
MKNHLEMSSGGSAGQTNADRNAFNIMAIGHGAFLRRCGSRIPLTTQFKN